MTLPPLREVIARHGLDARRKLGQHFLLDANLIGRIVRSAGALEGRQVIEVGPGPGGLTRVLLESGAAGITAIELDPRAVGVIEELAASSDGRLRVIEADALSLDLAAMVPAPRQIVANLPYNVATPLLIGWLRQAASFERMTLMFQLEVAERICAAPDTAAYGRLSVLAQWVCTADLALRIPPEAFVPPPQVASTVVRLDPYSEPLAPARMETLERVTAAAFGQRRKMLRQSLKGVPGALDALEALGIDSARRAETLSVADFIAIARAI